MGTVRRDEAGRIVAWSRWGDYAERVADDAPEVLGFLAQPEPDYRALRRRAYGAELGARPGEMEAVGDVLDALLRHVRARDGDANLHAELAEIARRVDAVKARFPKP